MFSWQMGPIKLITMLDYEVVKSLLMADNKVCHHYGGDQALFWSCDVPPAAGHDACNHIRCILSMFVCEQMCPLSPGDC